MSDKIIIFAEFIVEKQKKTELIDRNKYSQLYEGITRNHRFISWPQLNFECKRGAQCIRWSNYTRNPYFLRSFSGVHIYQLVNITASIEYIGE